MSRFDAPSRFPRAACSAICLVAAILLGLGSRAALAQDEMFVLNNAGSVTVYARTANGDVAPLRTISGAATGLFVPSGLALDTVNNELYVTNSNNSVTVYARTANGNVAPLRTILGAATGLNSAHNLAVDTINNELFVSNGRPSITVYARTANGNVAPLRTILGAATGLADPRGLAVDTVNNELLVNDRANNSVMVYDRTANGNVAPLRTIAGAATGLFQPFGLVADTVNNELLVANDRGPSAANPSVTVYARTANGDVAPLRTLVGAATGLNFPVGLAVDTVNNELTVTNVSNPGSVTVYARTASGNVAPLRTLAGAATGLALPVSVAVTTGAAPGSNYYTVTQCRLVDTRNPPGPYGGPALVANSDRTFVIATQCSIPSTANAVAFNFTVTQPTDLGDLRVVPAGMGLPLVSVMNWRPGQTRANNAIVSLGPSGDIVAHVDQASGTVHFIIDVSGYFQ